MAEFYNVDHHAINNYANKIGFDASKYKKQVPTEEQRKYIIDNYNQRSSTKLANELGLLSSTVSGIWVREGLTGKENRRYIFENQDYFEKIDSQDKAYYLGFIGADGCLYHPKEKYKNKQNILRIAIQYGDVDILEQFKKFLKTDKPIGKTKKNGCTYATFEISSNKVVSDIQKYGITFNKTYKNTIADIPKEFFPALIRGYFDGDGCISKTPCDLSNLNVSIVGYKSNLIKIQQFLKEKNIFANFTVDKRKYTQAFDGSPFGTLACTNKTSRYAFLKMIYENNCGVCLKRKYDLSMKYIDAIEKSDKTRDKQIVIYYNYAVQKVC